MALFKKSSKTLSTDEVGSENKPKRASRLGADKIKYYAEREQGRGNIELISLGEIALDPENPRTKGLSIKPLLSIKRGFMVIDPSHADYDEAIVSKFDDEMAAMIEKVCAKSPHKGRAEEFFKRLIPLRNNIRSFGVLQPIEVKSEGRDKYSIRYGHRRYIASILAGEHGIFSRIVSSSKGLLKATQYSENAHQEILTLHQRLDSLSQAIQELGYDINKAKAVVISSELGIGRNSMQEMLAILKHGSAELMDAIANGVIDNRTEAAKLSKLSDAECRRIINEKMGVEEPKTNVKPEAKAPGRQRRSISTPKIKNPSVCLSIMERFGEDISGVNKDSIGDVHESWNAFVAKLEQECQKDK